MKHFTLFLISLLLAGSHGLAQNAPTGIEQRVTESIGEYFKLDREGIHLHLNKSAYLPAEKIWFKGYVIQKQSGKPFIETTNVYVSLIDAAGQTVANVLLYAENSIFEGYISLPENIGAGVYYVQTYTNFMNNFAEDETSVYPITVVNAAANEYVDLKAVNFEEAAISLFPESENFIEGTANTFGVHIADCNGNGILVKDAQVTDSKGSVVTTFSTDASGYARFDLPEVKHETYKVVGEVNGRKIEKALPQPSVKGICFSVNNYVFADKASITVKTNSATLPEIKNRTYKLVIQNAGNTSFVDVNFSDALKQTLPIASDNFAEGVNAIFLIDGNAKKIGERVIYKPLASLKKTELLVSQKRGDSIVIKGQSPLRLGSLSVSILPSQEADSFGSISEKFTFGAIAADTPVDTRYYMDGFSRRKHYELDNMLMTQKSKYSWEKMTGPAPAKKHIFDKGLTIKGTINNIISDKANAKINLSSLLYGLNELSPINDKNEFVFENVMAQDSSVLHFLLYNKKDKLTDLKLYSQLSGNKRTLVNPFKPWRVNCKTSIVRPDWNFPQAAGVRVLDTVTILHNKKPKLDKDNLSRHANNMSRGYKISEDDVLMYRTVVDFIQMHGYNVQRVAGNILITRTYSTSFRSDNSPAIFVDDSPMQDMNLLDTYRMDMIDEIYINKRGYGGGNTGSTGIIRIYTKKGYGASMASTVKTKSKSLLVKDGFQRLESFKNPEYSSYSDKGFQTFGTIHWEPNISTDQNGEFRLSFPNFHQQKVKVFIEGIDSQGNVLSEIQTITLD